MSLVVRRCLSFSDALFRFAYEVQNYFMNRWKIFVGPFSENSSPIKPQQGLDISDLIFINLNIKVKFDSN